MILKRKSSVVDLLDISHQIELLNFLTVAMYQDLNLSHLCYWFKAMSAEPCMQIMLV